MQKVKKQYVSRTESIIWLILAISLFPFRAAHAYIDPGTGSFIIQMLVGAFFGAAYLVRRFWGSIIAFFKRFKKNK